MFCDGKQLCSHLRCLAFFAVLGVVGAYGLASKFFTIFLLLILVMIPPLYKGKIQGGNTVAPVVKEFIHEKHGTWGKGICE